MPTLLQATKAYAPHLGGIETIARQVGEGAVRAGWTSRALVASDDGPPRIERINDVEIQRVRSLGRAWSLPLAPGFAPRLLRSEADALLVHEPSVLPSLALAPRRPPRTRFGTIAMWWHSDIVRQRVAKPAYDRLLRRALDHVDHVITATPHHIDTSSYLPAYRSKVTVIPYGIDLTEFEQSADDAERSDRVRRSYPRPLYLYAGRLASYKGLGHLCAAAEMIETGHVVVVGSGPLEPEVRSSRAFTSGRLTLLPHLSRPDLVAHLRAADVFVLPSDQPSEAFGIVQLEAMACGTPVVTFDLPTGVTWVNRHDETGLVVPLGDDAALASAMIRLGVDDELRVRLGTQAQRRVLEEFGEDLMVSRVLALLDG